MKQKLSIVKIGGNVIEDQDELSKFLSSFSQLEGQRILVHGGGKLATELGQRLGVESKLIAGRRITDAQSLELITMVYGGLVNKNIVAQLQSMECNAIGLSGADGDTIQAFKRPVRDIDYGFVGDIRGVDSSMISKLLEVRLTPVFCAMTHNGHGQLLNTNADTIASELAIGMSDDYEVTLYYCFEKEGVLMDVKDDMSVIEKIDSEYYERLLAENVIADGMLPKMENCFHALKNGVSEVRVGNDKMLAQTSTLFTILTL